MATAGMRDPRAKLEEGVQYVRGGALGKAFEAFRSVIEGTADPALRAEAQRHQADIHRTHCEWDRALDAARESASIANRAGLQELYAEALNAEAIVHQTRGDFDAAIPLLERVLEVSSDERIRGIARQNLGYVAAVQGRLNEADTYFNGSMESFRASGYARGEAIALINRAQAALDRREPARAREFGDAAALAARRIGDLELLASAKLNLSEAVALLGELDRAAEMASAALGHFLVIENRYRQVECFRRLGDIHRLRGDSEIADKCFRQGRDLARQIGAHVEEKELQEKLEQL